MHRQARQDDALYSAIGEVGGRTYRVADGSGQFWQSGACSRDSEVPHARPVLFRLARSAGVGRDVSLHGGGQENWPDGRGSAALYRQYPHRMG